MNAGITIITLMDQQVFTRESLSTDGGIRLLLSLLVMVRAHEESATKSKRVSSAWERKRRQAANAKLTRTCPAWLRLAEDRLAFEVVEDRANIIRRIFNDTANGVGKGLLAASLNTEGVPAFKGRNGWHGSYIQKLIASDAPLGWFQLHAMEGGRRKAWGEPVRGYFPAIVDEDLAARARAAVALRRSGASGRRGRRYQNLFSGLVICGACGSRMTFVAKSAAETYLMCSAGRRARGCRSRMMFNYPQTESRVLRALQKGTADKSPTINQSHDPCTAVRAEVNELSGRLARFNEPNSAQSDGEAGEAGAALSLADRCPQHPSTVSANEVGCGGGTGHITTTRIQGMLLGRIPFPPPTPEEMLPAPKRSKRLRSGRA